MQYIENYMRKFPDLTDEELLEMYPEVKQEQLTEFRNNIGEANEPSRESLFSFTKADK